MSRNYRFSHMVVTPCTQICTLYTQICTPCTQIITPCTQICTPCTQICTPCTQIRTPCTQICTLCTQICTPCAQICTPCTQICTPCTPICTLCTQICTLRTQIYEADLSRSQADQGLKANQHRQRTASQEERQRALCPHQLHVGLQKGPTDRKASAGRKGAPGYSRMVTHLACILRHVKPQDGWMVVANPYHQVV